MLDADLFKHGGGPRLAQAMRGPTCLNEAIEPHNIQPGNSYIYIYTCIYIYIHVYIYIYREREAEIIANVISSYV